MKLLEPFFYKALIVTLLLISTISCNEEKNSINKALNQESIKTGAEQSQLWQPLLASKKVALVANHTSVIPNNNDSYTHLADSLISRGIDLKLVFAPEHGFRGKADAGEKVEDGKDAKTGLPLISLYGKHKKPTAEDLKDIDIIVFDIQDVGARFYTYISTMHYVMEAAAELNIPVVILDRPNPNGAYIDGPILEKEYQSFVGMHTIPVVHGLTIGELATMINEEAWLANGVKCELTVIKNTGYTHQSRYDLPIAPSPNLPDIKSIYAYPSTCFFEGTIASEGRGTDHPFLYVGYPSYPDTSFAFTPISKDGAKYPKWENKTCYGLNINLLTEDELYKMQQIRLDWFIDLYKSYPANSDEAFINREDFFNKLAGNSTLLEDIKAGKTAAEIRKSWQKNLESFSQLRQKYALYEL